MKKRTPKNDWDGIHDIYEKHTGLPTPLLDSDDSVVSPNNPDAPLEDAFDISGKNFNPFETAENPDLQSEEDAASMEGEYNTFALTENNDDEAEENAIDIMSFDNKEKFPLSDITEQDNSSRHGEIGDGIKDTKALNKRKKLSASAVCAIVICSALTVFLLWTILGVSYTNKYNKYIYEQFHLGVDVNFINPDFMFFITVGDETTLPVVKSDTPKYFTTLDGNFFAPGTLTSGDGMAITGSPKLLPQITSSLIGEKVIIESKGQKTEYTIHSVDEFNPHDNYDTPTVFTKDKLSQTGYIAFFTVPTETE